MAAERTAALWTPLPGPQTLAYHSPADVLGFGGAAGGGKSDLGIGLALTRHLRTLFLRKEAVNAKSLVDRARDILGGDGSYNGTLGVWKGIAGGRQVEFGGCANPGDEQKYRGRPHDLYVFDEADQFREHQFRFITGWNRTTTRGQRCRIVLTFNPPATAEGRWLVDFFAPWIEPTHPRPALPGELRWYAVLNGKEVERPDGLPFRHGEETVIPRSRTFVPARVTDNPHLTATGYIATLQALPEPLRSQLLYGDFSAGTKDDAWQVIPTVWVKAAMDRWAADGQGDNRLDTLGVDVARGGSAKTVVARKFGGWFAPLLKYPGRDTPDGESVVRIILEALGEHLPVGDDATGLGTPPAVNVDALGVGSSVFDTLKRLEIGRLRLQAVMSGNTTDRQDRARVLRFRNVRAWAWWSLREALDPVKGDGLALPPDPELMADLTAPRYSMTTGGVLIEPKDKIAERIGRSTDCGDAVVYACLPPKPGLKYKL